jgi:putrescine transport system permease protein
LIVIKISGAKARLSIPPFDNTVFNLDNYFFILKDSFYLKCFLKTIFLSLLATLLCLVIGFAIAYSIHLSQKKTKPILLLFVILPFWTSFLIRIYSWMSLLSVNGLVNETLLKLHIIKTPVSFLDTPYTVVLGVVYCYLPFMILPIFSSLDKTPKMYEEAALDLGASKIKTLFCITIPLIKSGIFSGCMMIFLPVMGEFVIPELLGGGANFMIGRVLWSEFFQHRNWPLACSLSFIIILIFVVPLICLDLFFAKKKQ